MKRFIILLAILLLAAVMVRADTDIDLDSNDKVDVAYGGTNAGTAATARTSLGAASASDLTTHTGNSSNPHSVTGAQTSFADTNSDFIATTVDGAIEELATTNGSGPNASDGKVHWQQIVGMPAGFADGSDDGAGGGSGTLTTLEEGDSQVGGADIVTLDFNAGDFNVTETPDTEINVELADAVFRTDTVSQVTGLTAEASPADTDLIIVERASDGALRKVEKQNIGGGGSGDVTGVLDDATGAVPILHQSWTAFTSTDTTPDVSAAQHYRTANASATTINDFDGSMLSDGRLLSVFVNDAYTTIDLTSSGIEAANRSTDLAVDNGTVLDFAYSTTDNNWHCINCPDETETASGTGFLYVTGGALSQYGWGGTGSATTVSRSDHNHTGTYQASDTDLDTLAGPTNWSVFYSNGSGVITELALGTSGHVLKSNGPAAAPSFQTDATGAGGGSVTTVEDGDAQVGGADIVTLDFAGSDFVVTESPDTEVNIAIAAASDTVAGKAELATTAETNTGTDATRALTPDGLAGSNLGSKEAAWTIYNSDTNTATGDGEQAFVVPSSMNGMNLIDATASVHSLNSATGGTTTVMLRRVRGATAVDMCSTGITIAYDAYTASDETVNTSNDDLQTGDKIYVDVDAITTGAAQQGLSVTAVFRLP